MCRTVSCFCADVRLLFALYHRFCWEALCHREHTFLKRAGTKNLGRLAQPDLLPADPDVAKAFERRSSGYIITQDVPTRQQHPVTSQRRGCANAVGAAALLPRLFGTNPRTHHKGATGRVRTGDQRFPVLCHCQFGQENWLRSP